MNFKQHRDILHQYSILVTLSDLLGDFIIPLTLVYWSLADSLLPVGLTCSVSPSMLS